MLNFDRDVVAVLIESDDDEKNAGVVQLTQAIINQVNRWMRNELHFV